MRKSRRKVWPWLIIHVSVLLLAPLPFLSLLAKPAVQSAKTQSLLRETTVGGVVASMAPVVEEDEAGQGVVMKGTAKDVLFIVGFTLGALGVTVGGGWACFIRTRTGSNWRLVGAVLIFVSLFASPLLGLAGADILSRGSVHLDSQPAGIQLTAKSWGSICIDRVIPSESDPRIILYPRTDRSSSDDVALVWSTKGGVEALWICSFAGEADPRAGKFAREISRASGLPFQVQRRDEEPE